MTQFNESLARKLREIIEDLGFNYTITKINEFTVWGDATIKSIYIEINKNYYKITYQYATENKITYKVIHQYYY